MTRGVPKELAAKAQEQYDKQSKLVQRMKDKRTKLMTEVQEINDKLEDEMRLMKYYSQHPLVTTKDEELPLVYGQERVEVSK